MTTLNNNEIASILEKIGFSKISINDEFIFVRDNTYYRFTLVNELGGYVIETADSREDAEKNLFEDSDTIENDCDKSTLVSRLKNYFNH